MVTGGGLGFHLGKTITDAAFGLLKHTPFVVVFFFLLAKVGEMGEEGALLSELGLGYFFLLIEPGKGVGKDGLRV